MMPLEDGEVHVWRWDLDQEEARPTLLSADEQARAERFHFKPDAQRWAASRMLLRRTLAGYLQVAPESLKFEIGPWGKPSLHGCLLRFNLSHSGAAALLAVAWGREVGADIEEASRKLSPEALAPQVLSRREQAWLRDQTPEQRSEAFLRLWTAKEAYVKATGQGLSFPLTRLTLLPRAGTDQFTDQFEASQIVSLCPIFVCRLDAGSDCFAALALEGVPASIRYFDSTHASLNEAATDQHCYPGV